MAQYWADDPIGGTNDDLLDRTRFVARTAHLIRDAGAAERSTVFGLVGPWGSGKTSLINLIEKELPAPWKVVRFTPWAASDISGLLAEFFATIASALPEDGNGAKAKKALLDCAQVAVPALLKFLPYAGDAAAGAAEAGLGRLTQEKPWQTRFDETCQQLQQLGTPVLVVADDIDRLDAGELTTLLKAVRLLGRFPGVHYLLAYDQDTVIDVVSASALVGSKRQRALEFLEKIVQYPLPIPPAQRAQLDRMLNAGLIEAVRESGHELDNEGTERFGIAYRDLIARNLKTVRSVQRYLAQARAYLPLIERDEIDVADMLVLLHLRLHFPQLYDRLPDWRSDLTGALDWTAMVAPAARQKPDWAGRLSKAGVPDELTAPVETVLGDIFPAMDTTRVRAGGNAQLRRVGNPDYFDRYFALGIPQDDVADGLVRQAVREIAGGEEGPARAELAAILTSDNDDRARSGLLKAAPLAIAEPAQGRVRLALFAAGLVPRLPDAAVLIGNRRADAIGWIAALLQDGVDEPARVVDELASLAGINAVTLATGWMVRDRDRGHQAPGLDALLPAVADRAMSQVLANLRARDAADEGDLIMLMVELVEEAGLLDRLVADVRASLSRGDWIREDVASRFVSVQQLVGGSRGWQIGSFQARRFSRIVATEGEVPEALTVDDIDRHDTTWPNRRRVATEALKRLDWREPEP